MTLTKTRRDERHGLDEIDIFDRELLADPYPFYERLRRKAPVWQVPGVDLFYVSSWESVRSSTG